MQHVRLTNQIVEYVAQHLPGTAFATYNELGVDW